MELKICHLYPDVLNLYGDRGNIIAVRKRLEWRGIGCSVEKLPLGSTLSLAGFDLVIIGGGQEFENSLLCEDLRRGRAAEIRAAAEDGTAFLAIGSGYQLLGRYAEDAKGEKSELAGAVDMYTAAGRERITGNYKFDCGGFEAVGFENHLGRTYLGEGVQPLGKVLCGGGNNGEDGSEGVRYKNLFGSYSHGPLLPKNPALCDLILSVALERKYGRAELEPLGDAAELAAHAAMSARLG